MYHYESYKARDKRLPMQATLSRLVTGSDPYRLDTQIYMVFHTSMRYLSNIVSWLEIGIPIQFSQACGKVQNLLSQCVTGYKKVNWY